MSEFEHDETDEQRAARECYEDAINEGKAIGAEEAAAELATLRAELAALRAERDTWKGIAGEYSDCLQDLCMTRLYDICRPVSHSWPGRKHVLSIHQAVDFLLERAEKAEAEVERLRKGIAAVSALIADSSGVYGLHLNGDPAPWDELLSGGRFEEWLADFDAARSES